MRPVNAIGVDTRQGFRTIELFEGDVTALDRAVDVVVVSAFAGSYLPSRGTVLEALNRNGRDISICFDITSWFGRW